MYTKPGEYTKPF